LFGGGGVFRAVDNVVEVFWSKFTGWTKVVGIKEWVFKIEIVFCGECIGDYF
jgi:hypothetical protein